MTGPDLKKREGKKRGTLEEEKKEGRGLSSAKR